jgi:hypothetical protein
MARLRRRGVVLAPLLLAISMAPAAAPAAASTYASPSIEATPNPLEPNGQLLALKCLAANQCMAVGSYRSASGRTDALAEVWDGTEWRQSSALSVVGAAATVLEGVSCGGIANCTAVGSYTISSQGDPVTLPIAEVWDGSTWRIGHVPVPAGTTAGQLTAVSCTSASSCMAVGNDVAPPTPLRPLVELWNGATWSMIAVPQPRSGHDVTLSSVSCASANSCTAVGSYETGTTLGASWNGQSWSVAVTPNAPPGVSSLGGALSGVSCSAANACTAVGYYDTSKARWPLTERWDGSAWNAQDSPRPPGSSGAELSAVFCSSAARCVATGAAAPVPLIESWDGSAWSIATSPALPAGDFGALWGVKCVPVGVCTAVGSYSDAHGNVFTLEETASTASWSRQSTVNPLGNQRSELLGLSCVSGDVCEAVGEAVPGSGTTTLAEVRSGGVWSIQRPAVGVTAGTLDGVSCVAASYCQAVGQSGTSALAELWDGSTWSTRKVPAPLGTTLSSVSCTSTSWCVGVGTYRPKGYQGPTYPLAEAWNGTTWKQQPVPAHSTSAHQNALSSVSCVSPEDCWAVGSYSAYNPGGGSTYTLAEHWNGTAWSIVPSGVLDQPPANFLTSVSCVDADFCVAAGYNWGSSSTTGFLDIWNGTSWKILVTAFGTGTELNSVSCAATSACAVVGFYEYSGTGDTVVGAWNGSKWTGTYPSNPGSATSSNLAATSCVTGARCLVVGSTSYIQAFPGYSATLAENLG